MQSVSLSDESIWGLPSARVAGPLAEADGFSTTSILNLLRGVAARHGNEIALVSLTESLDYRTLLRLAENAAYTVSKLVPPGQPIACLLPRSPDGVAGLLGCLISGRICMVLDPSHPNQRQAALLLDAAPTALMVAQPVAFRCAARVLLLADALAGSDMDWQPDHDWNPDAPCAVFFTSGSSGQPKGIVVSARSILYRALDGTEALELTKGDRVFAPSIPIAGSGLSSLIGALSCGSRVVLSDIASEGVSAVLRLVEREMVTCAIIQPPAMRLLFQTERSKRAFRSLNRLRIGAAGLKRADLAVWRRQLPSDCKVWHTYASTEAMIVASWVIPSEDSGPDATVAAGRLHPNHDYALLDEFDHPVPDGAPGELVLRSRYVALGEWQRGQLVAGRLPTVPGRPGWRYFRTGDILRVQPDGLVRMVGRADRQFKINGVRVEPAEIEAILCAEPSVTDAAVVAFTETEGVTLHGYVSAKTEDRPALVKALRQRLSLSLPSPLRPTRLIVLDQLPTLPSGKIDLLALSKGREG